MIAATQPDPNELLPNGTPRWKHEQRRTYFQNLMDHPRRKYVNGYAERDIARTNAPWFRRDDVLFVPKMPDAWNERVVRARKIRQEWRERIRLRVLRRMLRVGGVLALAGFAHAKALLDTHTADASILFMLMGSSAIAHDVGGGGGGGGDGTDLDALPHYGPGPSSITRSSYVSSNDMGPGTNHYVETAEELQTLLSGGDIGTGTLAGGDNIFAKRNVTYNTSSILTQTFGTHPGQTTSNPIRFFGDWDISQLPDVDTRWVPATHDKANAHFRAMYNSFSPFYIKEGATGWIFRGVQLDNNDKTHIYGILKVGRVGVGEWSSGATFAAGEMVYGYYVSLVDGNTGHDPASTLGTYWRMMNESDLPNGIHFDRFHVHSTINGTAAAVMYDGVDLTFMGGVVWEEGADWTAETHGMLGQSVGGPVTVDNCQITAATILSLVGGSSPFESTYNPHNLLYDRCLFMRPLRMNAFHADWDHQIRTIKNLQEFKRCVGGMLQRCTFENGWNGGTNQFFDIVWKSSNDGQNPDARCENITARYIKLIATQGPFGLGAMDHYLDRPAPNHCENFSVYQVYTATPFGTNPGPSGDDTNYIFQINEHLVNMSFNHITLVGNPAKNCESIMGNTSLDPVPMGWQWHDIVITLNNYGLFCSGAHVTGKQWFTQDASSGASHVIMWDADGGLGGALYTGDPTPFIRFTDPDDIFVDYAGNNFRLKPSFADSGSDGRTPGADIDLIDYHTRGCVSGVWS